MHTNAHTQLYNLLSNVRKRTHTNINKKKKKKKSYTNFVVFGRTLEITLHCSSHTSLYSPPPQPSPSLFPYPCSLQLSWSLNLVALFVFVVIVVVIVFCYYYFHIAVIRCSLHCSVLNSISCFPGMTYIGPSSILNYRNLYFVTIVKHFV